MRFRADQHLRRASDFNHVRTQGRRFDCGAFVLYYAPRAPAPAPRFASDPASAVETPAPAAPIGVGEAPGDAATAPTPPPPARAGFVASRSAVGNAVARARAKRRLREGVRAHQLAFPAGVDLVFVARRSLNGLEPAALDQRFLDLCLKVFSRRAS
jgi:ribonuclease P protein component